MSSPTLKNAAILATLIIAQTAGAAVLWDQSELILDAPGIANSDSPGWGGFTIHTVNDVTVGGDGWAVTRITLYYSSWNIDWVTAISEGYLHVFPKTGPLPVEDPSLSTIVPMTAESFSPDVIAVTAPDLNFMLDPGEYWISITPMAPAGFLGANLQFPTTVIGDEAASYDMMVPGWTNLYPGYDGAMFIEGDQVVPTESSNWSQVKSLYR